MAFKCPSEKMGKNSNSSIPDMKSINDEDEVYDKGVAINPKTDANVLRVSKSTQPNSVPSTMQSLTSLNAKDTPHIAFCRIQSAEVNDEQVLMQSFLQPELCMSKI